MLLIENSDSVKTLTEGTGDTKKYTIKGVFMQGEEVNQNRRVYPIDILSNETRRYVKEFVNKKRAVGELCHPESPIVNLANVSHRITKLKQDGNNIIGEASILSTPNGNIVKSLINEGVSFGVSSRGTGDVLERSDGVHEVGGNFRLSTIDIVHDPSAPLAFVESLAEGKEWVFENGDFRLIERQKKRLKNKGMTDLEELSLVLFEEFVNSVKPKL